MTTRQLLRLAFHRWYVLLLGLLLTGLAVGVAGKTNQVVYWSKMTVTLLQSNPNPLRVDTAALVGAASVLVIKANGAVSETKTSSPETTLYGEGVFDGARVRLRDVGGQWSTSVPDPVIYIEVVGPSRASVASQAESIQGRMREDLEALQGQLGSTSANHIFLRTSPETVEVAELGAASRTRALLGTMLLGLLMTGLLLFATEKIWPSRRGGEPSAQHNRVRQASPPTELSQ